MSERRAIDIALEIPPAHATATEAAEWARRLVAAVEREAAWLNDEREARAVAENSALKNMKTANEWRALAIDRGGIIEALKKQNAERLAAEARAERLEGLFRKLRDAISGYDMTRNVDLIRAIDAVLREGKDERPAP